MQPKQDITTKFLEKMLANYEGDKKQPFQYLIVPIKDLNTELEEYKKDLLHEFTFEMHSILDDYFSSNNAIYDFKILSGYINSALQEKYVSRN